MHTAMAENTEKDVSVEMHRYKSIADGEWRVAETARQRARPVTSHSKDQARHEPSRWRSVAGIMVRLARILCCWSSLAASLGCSSSIALASRVSSQNHFLRVTGVPGSGKADAASR